MTLTTHIKHLLIAGIIAAVVLVGAWKYFAYAGGLAHDQKTLAEEKLKNDLAIAKTEQTVTATDTTALQQQVSALTASNTALAASVGSLKQSLAQRQAQDAAASPTALSARWQAIVGIGVVTPQAQGLLVDLPAAHETVSELENTVTLKSELKAVQEDSAQKDLTLVAGKRVLDDTQAQLQTCQKTQTDAQAVCKAQVAEVKAKAWKRGIVGVVVAFIGGIVAGHKF